MRILFFGIYGQGLATLQRLVERNFEVVAAVTKPYVDLADQPVAEWAVAQGLPVLQPVSPRSDEFLDEVRRLDPDLIAVAAYHRVIPKSILKVPARGALNVHGSLLPKYRGPNPHKWAIIRGETVTGVTVHEMTPELDAGDILAQQPVAIRETDNGETLFQRIAAAGADVLAEILEDIQSGSALKGTPQDEQAATYNGYPTDTDTRINWNDSGKNISNLVRGLSPRPGAWSQLGAQKMRVWRASAVDGSHSAPPGTIVGSNHKSIHVAAAEGIVQIDQLGVDGDVDTRDHLSDNQGNLDGMRFD